MNDRIRTLADDALALGDKLGDLALDGHDAWSKHVRSGLESSRAAFELGRDAQRKAARAMIDGVVSRPADAAKQG